VSEAEKEEYGLLIEYEYCTGCLACVVACSQEYKWPAGMAGMKVNEIVENLPKDKNYLVYLPFPTELCVLCAARRKEGKEPACAVHCMARCIKCGPIERLATEMAGRKRMVLWKPR
jgi:Fe-S-cluster-containing dehydrogenase component